MSENAEHGQLLELTARIVAAHVGHNEVAPAALPELIRIVHATLAGAGKPAEVAEKPQPAVPVKKSVFPDFIICLEDGKKLKMLKRHLQTSYGLTPEQYREKWGCPTITRWSHPATPRSVRRLRNQSASAERKPLSRPSRPGRDQVARARLPQNRLRGPDPVTSCRVRRPWSCCRSRLLMLRV